MESGCEELGSNRGGTLATRIWGWCQPLLLLLAITCCTISLLAFVSYEVLYSICARTHRLPHFWGDVYLILFTSSGAGSVWMAHRARWREDDPGVVLRALISFLVVAAGVGLELVLIGIVVGLLRM